MGLWRGRKLPVWLWCVLVLGVLLIIGRAAGPAIAAKVVRKSLMQLKGGYYGDIDDVDLSVLSGEVHILGMRIVKANGRVPVPFMQVEDFTLAFTMEGWAPRSEVHLHKLIVNMVDAKKEADQQWGPDFKLIELRESLPAELAALYVNDAQVHFRNYDAKPKVDAAVHNLDVVWENLAGCVPPGWPTCNSQLRVKAGVLRSGSLVARGRFDRRDGALMQATANLTNLKPEQLNPVLLEYAKIDAQKGRIDVDARFTQREDARRVVLVPHLYGVEIAGSDREDTKWVRETAAGIAAGWFERKRGTKAIEYKKRGSGKGAWAIIDTPSERSAAEEKPRSLAHAE